MILQMSGLYSFGIGTFKIKMSKKYNFKARIYKVGINPCVKVPRAVTSELKAVRGYIPVKGTIESHAFRQTLVSVKDAQYRLYVNGPMLKGAGVKVGDTVGFTIEQGVPKPPKSTDMPAAFLKALKENSQLRIFENLIPSRKKEILMYMNYLKTEEARMRNINKVVEQLKNIPQKG